MLAAGRRLDSKVQAQGGVQWAQFEEATVDLPSNLSLHGGGEHSVDVAFNPRAVVPGSRFTGERRNFGVGDDGADHVVARMDLKAAVGFDHQRRVEVGSRPQGLLGAYTRTNCQTVSRSGTGCRGAVAFVAGASAAA